MIFKCKICGGSLDVKQGERVTECEYCGVKQTLPRLDDEKRANLYDRANHFRRNNEFDKAMGLYEQILNEDGTDSEAYWSLVLCRYGIEYVEDPSSNKRVPTVNRTQFTSVFDDDNYKFAIKYADEKQKALYQEEAKVINEIQKGILAISQKEEAFDVFICYKETDNNGTRTRDSVLAYDLYHQLTQEGFKVFFARITLEDKLGSAYEPYIFAALNSSKVMIVLGTKPEFFNAVWVKNEWSRYLTLIKNGEKKILIPAYKDMDAYDLPAEFAHLQAQDMSKLGFMQDLIRGIKKITATDQLVVSHEETKTSAGATSEALLKRVFMFLEEGDFKKADALCEQVLNLDPENGPAYLGKLMAELKVRKRENLEKCKVTFENNKNYQRLLMLADDVTKQELLNALKNIGNRRNIKNEEKKLWLKRAIKIVIPVIASVVALIFIFNLFIIPPLQYNNAIRLRDQGEYEKAKQALTRLGDYKDVPELLKKFVVVPTKVNNTKYIYDQRGNLIKKENEYNRYGGKTVQEYIFNEKNQLVAAKYFDTENDEGENSVDSVEYVYNEQGHLVKKKRQFLSEIDEPMSESTDYHYDQNGNMIKFEAVVSGGYGGGYSYGSEYTYDDKMRLVKEVDSNGVTEYQYDNEDNRIFEKISYSDGSTNITERFYDTAGNCLKEEMEYTFTNGNMQTTKYEYYYDENHNCIKLTYYASGLHYYNSYTEEFMFDEQNYCTKEIRISDKDKSESSSEYSYEYILIYRESDEPIKFNEFGQYELPEIYVWY